MTKRTEHSEQAAVVEWARANEYRQPELALLFAVPNAGKRRRGAAGRMIAEGMKAGVPDLCLPVARGGYGGLFIEMKSDKGKVSEAQSWWIEKLRAQGYRVEVCRGYDPAKALIEHYLEGIEA